MAMPTATGIIVFKMENRLTKLILKAYSNDGQTTLMALIFPTPNGRQSK